MSRVGIPVFAHRNLGQRNWSVMLVHPVRSPPMAYDPLVINAVESVRDRFGADGLRSLIELATRELDRTEAALTTLAPRNGIRHP